MGMGETSMSQTAPEVIRVGTSGARIVRVTRELIEYIDTTGQERFVDLEECARNWGRWHDERRQEFLPLAGASPPSIAPWNARCVGRRGALGNPPWAEFMNERKTRFEFRTYQDLYGELLRPLKQAGWHTFDTD
jgi:hypothetical protein